MQDDNPQRAVLSCSLHTIKWVASTHARPLECVHAAWWPVALACGASQGTSNELHEALCMATATCSETSQSRGPVGWPSSSDPLHRSIRYTRQPPIPLHPKPTVCHPLPCTALPLHQLAHWAVFDECAGIGHLHNWHRPMRLMQERRERWEEWTAGRRAARAPQAQCRCTSEHHSAWLLGV
jgi:hypothetical protein